MKQFLKLVVYTLVATAFSSAYADDRDDFFHAINLDNGRMAAGLLERGVDPNAVDDKGQTALTAAMRDGSGAVVEVLLRQPGLKVDKANRNDETPLMMAALKGHTDWMRALLERGAAVNRSGWTALHYAASGPEPKAITLLLDKGAAIEAASPNQTTPLMMAARYGAIDSAELLLSRGASTTARNEAGLTAIDFARTAGRDKLVQTMERRGK
ncbi:MAG: ankyrin repeat domain-containing protein [Pseudomonadota bacterium]|nr:ankyrin repeat domain-containing protein [Pseudomonadota bacterium]